MPRLSDSMEEGTIVRWLKQDGEQVARGEPLAEVETDKATVTFEADADGILRILVGEGQTVPIGGLIARIGEAAESPPPPAREENGRVKASPLARRIARETGVDLSQLAGTGPGGRIVKADVSAAAPAPAPPAPAPPARRLQLRRHQPRRHQPRASAPAPSAPGPSAPGPPAPAAQPARGNKGAVTIQQLSRTQVQIAQRMAESKATIPDFTLHAEADMEQAVALARPAAQGRPCR